MKAKKSLGQNFLKSILALNKIIETGEISKNDIILEIGPGKGILTKRLLEKAKKVIAVEKDYELYQVLQEKFEKEIEDRKFILLNKDILDFNAKVYGLEPNTHKIIANIPYNITGAILKKFLTEENQPNMMVLMLQYEVAKRIMGRNPTKPKLRGAKESILSLSVKAYGEPKIIMKVPARYFSPAPKVDSAIISIKNISKNLFKEDKGGGISSAIDKEKNFWEIVHAGFAHKRKMLISNLKSFINKNKKKSEGTKGGGNASALGVKNSFGRQDLPNLLDIFKKLNISEKARAEDLSLLDWIMLTNNLR